MDPTIKIFCFIQWYIFCSFFANSCDNIIRLADLRNTIENQTIQSEVQTRVIEEQRRINEEQKNLNENLSQVIENQMKVLEDQRSVIENQTVALHGFMKKLERGKTGVHFMVGLSRDAIFMRDEIIKFDKVITNVGGGYIDDDSNADYGKFIAPQDGAYLFSANFHNENMRMGADLRKNRVLITGNSNGGSGAASLSTILDLEKGDQVYLERPNWVTSEYNSHFTSFSGALLHAEV